MNGPSLAKISGALIAVGLLGMGCAPVPSPNGSANPGQRIAGPPVVPGEPTLRLDQGPEDAPRASFLVEGLEPAEIDALAAANLDPTSWNALFHVQVADGPTDAPPMLGRHAIRNGALAFEPRFPLQPGLRYRARFDPSRLPRQSQAPATGPTTAEFVAAPPPDSPATTITHVYPTRDLLPANQLKIYVHFSAPMSRGDAYQHMQLLDDATGRPIALPFLEIAEELWDPRQTRLTLLFDPARVKRGLASRDEAGPILEPGKSYTLAIDKNWPDAQSKPLAAGLRKTFRAGPPDETPIDPNTWNLQAPTAGTIEPLTLTFPEPLDHAMLQRVLTVVHGQKRPVAGTIAIDQEEMRWRFTPKQPWKSGDHAIVIDTLLEDLAGNAVDRPFELDVFNKVERTITTETVERPFRVAEAK